MQKYAFKSSFRKTMRRSQMKLWNFKWKKKQTNFLVWKRCSVTRQKYNCRVDGKSWRYFLKMKVKCSSAPPMTYWSLWRIAIESSWLGTTEQYPREVSLRTQWWWCTRDLKLDRWLIAVNNFQGELTGCIYIVITLQIPKPLGWIKRC